MTRVVFLSDTHGNGINNLNIPKGDVLIHCGDATYNGTAQEIHNFNESLKDLNFKKIIFIPGNHDFIFENDRTLSQKIMTNADVLIDKSIIYNGIKIYGSPWQPRFCNWAFNLPRGNKILEKWDLIEKDADIVVTHGPPLYILDKTKSGEHVGCYDLAKIIKENNPKIHAFGHIHESYGIERHKETYYVNASIVDCSYVIRNKPFVFDIDEQTKEVVLIQE